MAAKFNERSLEENGILSISCMNSRRAVVRKFSKGCLAVHPGHSVVPSRNIAGSFHLVYLASPYYKLGPCLYMKFCLYRNYTASDRVWAYFCLRHFCASPLLEPFSTSSRMASSTSDRQRLIGRSTSCSPVDGRGKGTRWRRASWCSLWKDTRIVPDGRLLCFAEQLQESLLPPLLEFVEALLGFLIWFGTCQTFS